MAPVSDQLRRMRREAAGVLESAPVEYIETADAEDGARVHRVVTSAQVRDRARRLLIQSGWKLENYAKNPTVLWAHDSDRLPIGEAQNVHVGKRRKIPALLSDLRLYTDESFPAKVDKFLAARRLNAVSAGWTTNWDKAEDVYNDDGEWVGVDMLENELVEQSIVPVPANPESLRIAASLEMHREEIELLFENAPTRLSPRAFVDLAVFRARVDARRRSMD